MDSKKLKLLAKLATSALALNAIGLGAQVSAMEKHSDEQRLVQMIDTTIKGILSQLNSQDDGLRHDFVDIMSSATQCLIADYPDSQIRLDENAFFENLKNSATSLRKTTPYDLDLGFRMKRDVNIVNYTGHLEEPIRLFCKMMAEIGAWSTEETKLTLTTRLMDYQMASDLSDDGLKKI